MDKRALLAALWMQLIYAQMPPGYTYCKAPSQNEVFKTNFSLVGLQVITRHGDRSMITRLPTDNSVWDCNFTTYLAPSSHESDFKDVKRVYRKDYMLNRQVIPGTCFLGELTPLGYQQHIELGEALRETYVNTYQYLNASINMDDIWIRSTDIPRTLASVQGHMHGLYPPTKTSGDIPVFDEFTIEANAENMYPNAQLCPALAEALINASKMPEYIAYMKQTADLQKSLLAALQLSVFPSWDGLFDAFSALACHNFSLLPGVTQEMWDQTIAVANWQWNFQLNQTNVVRLGIGSFMAEIVDVLELTQKSPASVPKYIVYSGHDTTIGPLMAAMQNYDGYWPPYASHVEIELWENNGAYFVAVRYQGAYQVLSTCQGQKMCPYAQFLEAVNPFLPTNFVQECSL